MADYKTEGNTCFKAGKFAEAADWYTRAIEIDANNPILYSNRSGAHYELKQYDKAISDAKRSLELQPSSKAHSRMGAAYWAQNKLEQALTSYELALAMAPNDTNAKSNIAQLKAKIGDVPRPQVPPPALAGNKVDAALDLAIVVLTALQIICSMLAPQLAGLLYKGLLATMVGRSALILQRQGLLRPQLQALKSCINQFAGQYLALCLVLLVAPFQPMPTIMGAIAIYAVVDIAVAQRGAATSILPILDRLVGSRLDTVRQNRDGLLVNAAVCEIASAFLAILTGSFVLGMLLLQFFLKFRYRTDSYSKYAWGYLAQMLGKVFYHPRCPPFATGLFDKARNGLHSLATR